MKFNLHLTFLLLLSAASCLAQSAIKSEIDAFAAKTGAIPTIDKATGSLSFLRFPKGKALSITGSKPQDKALSFVRVNAGLFSIQADKDSYLVKENKKDNYGLDHVVLQQYYQGVPIYDGLLKFHFNKSIDLAAMNGNFIKVSKLNTVPSVSKEMAADAAIKLVTGQKLGSFKAPLKAFKTTLYVFQKGLAQGYTGAKYLVYEVEVRNDANIREFLYIDAHTKALVEQFTGMHNIDRKLYETSAAPANLKWEEANGNAGAEYTALDVWQKSEVETSGHIYNFMKNAFGFVSYDGADATMITINNNPEIDCPNANWNGVTANYCTGTAADDVVAHEWGHAYTEYTSGLIYAWQSGAINEGYSDIWGETVDQLNNYMDAEESNALRTACGSSARWMVGEETTAFNGALRDMWNPNCKGDPAKVTDAYYHCATTDYGGVHTNSSVLNHAYALLVDGGTYNGQTITGIGLTKAAHIFWHAQSTYMTSTTDFSSLADMLETSLDDLKGLDLEGLSTTTAAGPSGQILTTDDAAQLKKVLLAVELRSETNCNFQPILQPLAAICSGGEAANAIFYEDFENGLGAWTVSNTGSTGTWTPRNWALKTSAPAGRAGKVVYGVDYTGGDCGADLQNGVISFTSPVITIPAGSDGPFNMAFDHYIATEAGYDGGNIRYRINGGTWVLVPVSAFIANGYNVTLQTTANGNNNPLQGQAAYSGSDPGSNISTWGQSRINLSALGLTVGQTIQFRFDMGTDGCGGSDGWYIDDVRVYTCAETSVQFTAATTMVNEGEATITSPAPNECLTYVEKIITVKINKTPSAPVTVTLNTPTGTATQGATADYSITPASFTLQAGTLSRDVTVRIYNDAYVEGNETIVLTYSLNAGAGNAFAADANQEHIITIADDDIIPGVTTLDVLSANFNTGLPAGWNIVGGGSYPATWGVVSFSNVALDPAGTPLLFISSDAAGEVPLDKIVESAPFNSVGMSAINLSFIEYFRIYNGGFAEKGLVDVWDGSAWQNVFTQTQATGTSGTWTAPATRNISIPAEYANAAMKIRFRYIANYDYWWAIDNVKITGNIPKEIQSSVSSTADAQYLGPDATAYFYDPATGSLMVKIENLTAFDYGCTSVEIDRAGTDGTTWFGPYHITNKTFKVTPANTNAAGSYKITLYYKASNCLPLNPTLLQWVKAKVV